MADLPIGQPVSTTATLALGTLLQSHLPMLAHAAVLLLASATSKECATRAGWRLA